ncbi:hypothetical protein NNRS527_02213 [Nitrosospira sp. NRS527]|nr:hypothetical protein NNRS527_02213 [Nitrosospira sp. NRS527]
MVRIMHVDPFPLYLDGRADWRFLIAVHPAKDIFFCMSKFPASG